MLSLDEDAILKNPYTIQRPLSSFQLFLLVAAIIIIPIVAFITAQLWHDPTSLFLRFLEVFALLALIAFVIVFWNNRIGRPRLVRWQVNRLHLRGNEEILDVGVSTGDLLVSVAKRNPHGHTNGVVFQCESKGMCKELETATQIVEHATVVDRVTLQPNVQSYLPFPDDHFDAVVSDHALYLLTDMEAKIRMLCEMARVLKTGGRLLVTDHSDTFYYRQTLQQLGWQEVKRIGPHWMVVPFSHTIEAIKPG